jgi:ParB family chromosome partitioning protein
VNGELDQTKLARSIKAQMDGDSRSAVGVTDRTIEKIFSGKHQAGSITKDALGFTVKIKAGMMSTDKEQRIRALISELFSNAQGGLE